MKEMNSLTKQKRDSRLMVRVRGESWGKMEGEKVRELGVDINKTLYLKWITNKGLLCTELCSVLCGLNGRGV